MAAPNFGERRQRVGCGQLERIQQSLLLRTINQGLNSVFYSDTHNNFAPGVGFYVDVDFVCLVALPYMGSFQKTDNKAR